MVIKEELVELTGDFRLAIVLQQMIYWSERIKDVDKYIQEEVERFRKYSLNQEDVPKIELSNGWIYKKSEELSEETMIGVLPKAMRGYLKALSDKGWLSERKNPNIPMDRTYQYRVNLIKIQQDLLRLGYALEGYRVDLTFISAKSENDVSYFPKDNTNGEKENRKGEKENRKGEKERAIPKTTTKTTPETNLVVDVVANPTETKLIIHFESNICQLKATPMKKYLKVTQTYSNEFIVALIDYCATINTESYAGFEIALNNFVQGGADTPGKLEKAIEDFRNSKNKKPQKKTTAQEKKKGNFNTDPSSYQEANEANINMLEKLSQIRGNDVEV